MKQSADFSVILAFIGILSRVLSRELSTYGVYTPLAVKINDLMRLDASTALLASHILSSGQQYYNIITTTA